MRSVAAATAAAAVLVLAPAASAATSVEVGKRCYAEGDRIAVDGAGFTPDGFVRLSLERGGGEVLESTPEAQARSDGTLVGGYGVSKETGWFSRTQTRFEMTLRLVDQTRLEAGQPATSPDVTATTSFIFSRWNVGIRASGGKIHPRRPARIVAVGYTNAVGKPLYAHWIRRGRRVHTRRLGVLRGPCGDLRTRLSRGFPFRPVAPGTYQVRFNTSRRNAAARDSIVHRTVRVRRRLAR